MTPIGDSRARRLQSCFVVCRLVFYEHPVSGKNHSERVPAWGSTVSASITGFTLWDLQLDYIRYGTLSRKKV